MFNPTPQRAPAQAWTPNPVIQPPPQGEVGFASTDWVNVPRVDYRTEKFRQLAIPDPARVVEDTSEFEPWQPKQLGRDPTSAAAKAEGQSRSSDFDKTSIFSEYISISPVGIFLLIKFSGLLLTLPFTSTTS